MDWRQINQRRHNSPFSLVGLSIIHPCQRWLVGLHLALYTHTKNCTFTLFSTENCWDCTQSFLHTQNCRINEASNSPKPLVVSSLSLLNLFRAPKIATDEKLSSHFLSLKPSNLLGSLKLPRMRNCRSLFLSFVSCHLPINLHRSSPYHHIHFITGTRKSKLRNWLSCF